MRLSILAVGRMKSGPESELFAKYFDRAARAGRQLGISGLSHREIAESRHANPATRREEEAARLAAMLSPGSIAIILDEKGEDLASQAFAGWIRSNLDGGTPEISFLVGGPDGHGKSVHGFANRSIRFGSLTWPHQIVRVLVAEQLYRAMTLLSGHPYHRV